MLIYHAVMPSNALPYLPHNLDDGPSSASSDVEVLSPSSLIMREKYLKFGLLASATDQVISFSHILTLFASGYGTYLEARTRRSRWWSSGPQPAACARQR